MSHKQFILAIDDDPMILKLLSVRLRDLNAEVICAEGGEEGLKTAYREEPDLILLDVSMPGMDGFEVCKRLRNDARTRDIPVIFLTGSDDPDQKSRGFELGAMDYVTKPFDACELLARVRSALRQQALVAALEAQATTDSLTGLPNRAAFKRRLNQVFDRARASNTRFMLMFIDLDRFKQVNDSLGHSIGDQLLIAVSDILRNSIRHATNGFRERDSDYVARMGGDEFTVLVENVDDEAWALNLADRLRNTLTQQIDIDGHQVHVGASIGIRLCDGDDGNPDDLMRDSDTAMYHAKAEGKGRCVLFDEQMHHAVAARLDLEQALHRALENKELSFAYQPVIDMEQGELRGFEALLRWVHPRLGNLSPELFIPIAEETGLIIPIGRWCISEAFRQLRRWRNRNEIPEGLHMAVNLSKVQLMNNDIQDVIADALHANDLEPKDIHLEVTESTIMHDVEQIVPVLDQVRDMGISIAMDDFGTGYSSLASLHRFPVDILKIDRQFVNSMLQSREHAAVVNAIVMLADNLGMTVVAEGVETADHLLLLQAMGCTYGQGYYFARPLPSDMVTSMLKKQSWFGEGLSDADGYVPALV